MGQVSNNNFRIESLEPRQLLSAVHPDRVRPPLPPGFGAIGDSDTQQYTVQGFTSTAFNYVDQLSKAGIAYFGPNQPPYGLEYDWGAGGATSSDMTEQVNGLLPEIKNGDLQYVTIMLGGNDFEDALLDTHAKTELQRLPSIVWKNVLSGIQELQAADPNLRIALSTLYPIEDEPDKQALVANGTIEMSTLKLADVEQNIVNADIRHLAKQDHNVVAVDFDIQMAAIESTPSYTIGDVVVNTRKAGNSPWNFWLKDGEHYGTIEQGLWANLILSSINTRFGTTFAQLTNAQILDIAGLS